MKKNVTTIEELGDVMQDDFLSVGNQIDELRGHLGELPTRGELGELIAKTYDYATLKAEHDRIKAIIKEKLGAEV